MGVAGGNDNIMFRPTFTEQFSDAIILNQEIVLAPVGSDQDKEVIGDAVESGKIAEIKFFRVWELGGGGEIGQGELVGLLIFLLGGHGLIHLPVRRAGQLCRHCWRPARECGPQNRE